MYCIVLSCVVYFRLKAFGEKSGKIKLTQKLAILQYRLKMYVLKMYPIIHNNKTHMESVFIRMELSIFIQFCGPIVLNTL